MQQGGRHPDLRQAVALRQKIRRGEEAADRTRYEKHCRLRKLEAEIDDARIILAEKELALYRHVSLSLSLMSILFLTRD